MPPSGYVDDAVSFPVSVTGATQILTMLAAAGLLNRLGQVNGLPLIVQRADDGSFSFDHIAAF